MKSLKPCWVLTYSFNDYYGEQEQFCFFCKFMKDIPAAIIKDAEKRSMNLETSMHNLKRINPDTFELKLGDSTWTAKKTLPFVVTS